MRKYISLECDACGQVDNYLSDGPHDLMPDACRFCGVSATDNLTEMPPKLNIHGWRTKSKDMTYRNFEKQAEHNMHVAHEQTGVDYKDLAGMKITNMRSDIREGETAAVAPVQNAVTQQMEFLKSRGTQMGFTGAQGGGVVQMVANDKGMVSVGGTPNNERDGVFNKIQAAHGQNMAAIPKQNQIAKYSE